MVTLPGVSSSSKEAAVGMRVVGGGIETPGQLERLRALRCDMGQGYHFSRPLSERAMDDLLAKNPRYL